MLDLLHEVVGVSSLVLITRVAVEYLTDVEWVALELPNAMLDMLLYALGLLLFQGIYEHT